MHSQCPWPPHMRFASLAAISRSLGVNAVFPQPIWRAGFLSAVIRFGDWSEVTRALRWVPSRPLRSSCNYMIGWRMLPHRRATLWLSVWMNADCPNEFAGLGNELG